MGFFGIGGLEFLLIFGIALFVVGPRRLADGVRTGRRVYTELKRQRDELTSLVSEALEIEELKEELQKDVGDLDVRREAESVKQGLALDQADPDELLGLSVPRTSARAQPGVRGNGRIGGEEVPAIDLSAGDAPPPQTSSGGTA